MPVPDTGPVSVARQARLWQWAAVAYTVLASAFFALMPLIAVPARGEVAWVAPYTLLGWLVFPPLLIPVALTLVPLLVRRRRVLIAWICTGALGVLCLLLILSWGLLLVPAALFGAVGAHLTARAPIEDEEIDETPWQVPGS